MGMRVAVALLANGMGKYSHGERTKAAIAEQRKFSALLKCFALTRHEHARGLCGPAHGRRAMCYPWSGWRHVEGPANAWIQNNSGLPQGLAGLPMAG